MPLYLGVDDTDSLRGMCTTFLATELVRALPKWDLIGFPRLVRLNPNIPWKTRGNGAIFLRLGKGQGRRSRVGMIDGRDVWAHERGASPPPSEEVARIAAGGGGRGGAAGGPPAHPPPRPPPDAPAPGTVLANGPGHRREAGGPPCHPGPRRPAGVEEREGGDRSRGRGRVAAPGPGGRGPRR